MDALTLRRRALGAPIVAARSSVAARRIALVGLIVLVWAATTGDLGESLRIFERAILPTPSATAADLVAYARSGLLWSDMSLTLGAAFLGLTFGMLGGVAVGLALGYWRAAAETLEPVLVGLNSLPRVALAPILVIWFGLGLSSKVVLSLFTVFFVVFFNTFLGVRSVDPELVKAVRVMGATRAQIARLVVIPSVFAWIFAALRTSVSFALIGVVVAEFVGSSAGLGYRMHIAAGLLNTERVFAILLILMVVSVTLVEIARRVERHLLRWRPSAGLSS